MVLRSTTKFTRKDGLPRPFYGCTNFPVCRATHGAHPDGRPLGIPGDAETKRLRSECHAVFDTLWKEEKRVTRAMLSVRPGGMGCPGKATMTRGQAYKLLQNLMGLGEEDCHIGRFSAEQCREAVRRIEEWKANQR
jgi:hypothetical protein